MKFGPGKWTLTPEPRPDARMRLICLHHAGGGAYGFRAWSKRLHQDVELVAVQLPGRENRFSEPPARSADALLAQLVPALAEMLQRPYVIFGHSLGARLGFHLAQDLSSAPQIRPPSRLILSGARPALSRPVPNRPPPSDEALIATLTELGGTPPSLLENEDLLKVFLPTIRADMELNGDLRGRRAQVLDVPLTIFGGAQDHGAPPEHLEEWRAHTTGAVRTHIFPGGHFFTQSAVPEVIETINLYLRADLAAAAR